MVVDSGASVIYDHFNNVVVGNFSNTASIDKLVRELHSQKVNLDKKVFCGSEVSAKETNRLSFLSIQYSRLITLLDAVQKYENEKNEENKTKLKKLSETYDESVEDAVLVLVGEQLQTKHSDDEVEW